mgnify:CR=1 FL=1
MTSRHREEGRVLIMRLAKIAVGLAAAGLALPALAASETAALQKLVERMEKLEARNLELEKEVKALKGAWCLPMWRSTKFITVAVQGGKDVEDCRKVGYAIGHSPLVKTAFFASDPNLGRILAAIGYAGITDLGHLGRFLKGWPEYWPSG